MRIALYNPNTMAFTVATPESQPLGGIASSLCYLARALTARGHDVTLVTTLPEGVATGAVVMGVRHVALADVLAEPAGFFRAGDYDVAIATNYPEIAPHIKNGNPRTISIAWLHVYPDQPALVLLGRCQPWIDCAVAVSETLRGTLRLSIPTATIRNAIAPYFENMFAAPAELLAAKRNRAIYASMPFRGLDVMVEVMNRAKGKVRLDVFSSMRAYQASDQEYAPLYKAVRRNPRITYHSGLGQKALAEAFRAAAFLTYPSTFIETYCIVAQEAIAAGAKVIANDLGALPETTMGFADLLPVRGLTIPVMENIAGFTALLEKNEADFRRDPQAWAEARFSQMQAVNRDATWANRAAQWEAFLGPAVAARPSQRMPKW